MASLNKFLAIGNVTKDVDARFLPNGDAVSSFSIAINENYKDKQGNKQEKTEFVNIIAFRRLGEICSQYLKKGSQVYIEGKFQTRKWEKDGVTRYATEIVLSEMQMLGAKSAQTSEGDSYTPPAKNDVLKEQESGSFDDFEDSIPF